MNKNGKKVAAGPIGLAIDRKQLTNDPLQQYGERLPGRSVDYKGMYKLEPGKKFWYATFKRGDDSESASDAGDGASDGGKSI